MSARRLLVVNPNTDARITAWLAAEARRVAAADVVVEAVNADSGFAALETPEQVERAADAVVQTLLARRPQSALIGAFGEPGLARARALGVEAVGLGTSGLRAAAEHGSFAILTLGAAMRDSVAAQAGRLALGSKLTEIRLLPHRIADFVRDRDAMSAEVAASVLDLARGACCVLLAGAPFAGLAHRLSSGGVVLLDGVESCLTALGLSAHSPKRP